MTDISEECRWDGILDADATGGKNLSDVQRKWPGIGQAPHSDGSAPTLTDVLMQQAKSLEVLAFTIQEVTSQNMQLVDRLLSEDEEEEAEQGAGLDMAGNRIRVT